MEEGRLILGEGQYYSLDCHKTGLNNNVLVVGASGSGKTRSYVIPNLLQASGSYIVSDPKGNLYKKYRPYLIARGYDVRKLDFTDPEHSSHYNFFNYIRTPRDINKIAHMLTMDERGTDKQDPFWDRTSELLLGSLITFLKETGSAEKQNLENILTLIDMADGVSSFDDELSDVELDKIIDAWDRIHPESFAVSRYKKVRCSAARTWKSVLISLNSHIALYDSPEVRKMTATDDIDITSIGKMKRAVFVVVSDTDRSLDGLASIFFTQAMNELCEYADKQCKNNTLPVPVRFILDDFATNVKIPEFPRMISSIRSRGISAMLMIQSEAQLKHGYGEDYRTIIGNCDSYLYLGCNDVDTAQEISRRADVPLKKILYMKVGENILFRRGQEPVHGKNIDLDKYMTEIKKNKIINRKSLEATG